MTDSEKLDKILALLISMQPPEVSLDGEWDNPEVRKDPKNWKGESYVGKRYSECPSAFLRQLANLLDWMAKKNDEEQKLTAKGAPASEFNRKDAARARGWAKRNEGKDMPAQPAKTIRPEGFDCDDESLPF